jgi:GAF domain-containing protein
VAQTEVSAVSGKRNVSPASGPGLQGTSQALQQLGRIALRDQTMNSLLQSVVDLAKGVMPGDPEASISLIVADKAISPVYTGQLALDCDESQYDHGDGPCLHAATTGELTEIADTESETRWADYCRRAAERGARGSLSIPLPVNDQIAGALNIYVREANAFDDDTRSAATKFAPYAAVAIANMHAYEDARNMADNLTRALENRAVIDQAKGILMERYRLTADQAFHTLARISMASHRKLRSIADDLVRTGELPGVPRPEGDSP